MSAMAMSPLCPLHEYDMDRRDGRNITDESGKWGPLKSPSGVNNCCSRTRARKLLY